MGDRAKPFATAPGKGSQVSVMLHLGPSVPHTQHLHGPGSSSTRVWEQTAPPRHYSILSTMKGRLNRKAPRVQGLWTHGGARRRQDLDKSLVFSQGRSWETPPPARSFLGAMVSAHRRDPWSLQNPLGSGCPPRAQCCLVSAAHRVVSSTLGLHGGLDVA